MAGGATAPRDALSPCTDADEKAASVRVIELSLNESWETHDQADARTDGWLNNTPVDDTDIDIVESENLPQPTINYANERPLWFFMVLIALVSIIGMWVASFGALVGGKWGFVLPKTIFEVTAFGIVDSAVTINEQPGNALPRGRSAIMKRGVCWLAIGLLQGTASALSYISVEGGDVNVWKPEPIFYELFATFICRTGLVAGVMMRAHRDRRPNVMRWFSLIQFAHAVASIGGYSPYPLISSLGSVLFLLIVTFGSSFLVMYADKGAEQSDVQNGYKLLVGFMMAAVPYFNLKITSFSFLGVFAVSALLMLFQKVCLKLMIPILKRCFGNDERKLWSYAVPAVMLMLELGPCLLTVGSDIRTLEFWGLLLMQEANSVAKNTGKYSDLYVIVHSRVLRRPVDEETRKVMEERRQVIAPCDNIGEIVSPVVIMIAIGLESLFGSLPFERAPYLAKNGVLGGWRNQRFRGEAPIMLSAVLMIRIVFCWIEIKVRAHERSNGSNRRAQKKRSSMVVLYTRIAHSDGAAVHMKYLAIALFALQPMIFLEYAAEMGRQRDISD